MKLTKAQLATLIRIAAEHDNAWVNLKYFGVSRYAPGLVQAGALRVNLYLARTAAGRLAFDVFGRLTAAGRAALKEGEKK